MRITRLHINSFGNLEDVTLEFDSGFQLIEGPNESGKSTLHAFIRAMLFGMEKGRSRSSKDSGYRRYLPWNRNPAYGGSLELAEGSSRYSIYRNFDASHATCRVFDETRHLEVSDPEAFLKEFLRGLNPQLFDNTLSIAQLTAEAGKPLADELRNHIVNLRTTGSAGIDVSAALTKLKLQKRMAQSSFSRPAQAEAEELDRQIASFRKLADSSSVSSELGELEEKKAETERMIQHYATQHQAMADKAQADLEYLQRFQIGSEEQVNELLAEADDLYEALTRRSYGNGASPEPFSENDASGSERGRRAGATDSRRGQPDSRRGQPDNRHGQPDNRRGQPDSRHGQPDSRRGQPDSRRGQPDNRRGQPDGRRGEPDDGQGHSDRTDSRSSGLNRTQLAIAIIYFIAAAVLLILGINRMSKGGQGYFLTVLFVAGGLACLLLCIMQFTRNSNSRFYRKKKSNFNIDLDKLYSEGVTDELLAGFTDDEGTEISEAMETGRRASYDGGNDGREGRTSYDGRERRTPYNGSNAGREGAASYDGSNASREGAASYDGSNFSRERRASYKGSDSSASDEFRRLEELYNRFCPDGDETGTVSRLSAVAYVLKECRQRLHSSKSSSQRMKADMESLLESRKQADEINSQLDKARKAAWQAEKQYEELRQLQDRRDALEETLTRNRHISEDVEALDLAIKTLQELSSTSFGTLGYYLDQRTSQIAEELTEGSCTDITVGGDLNVTLRQGGRLIPLSYASRGTVEQIWFALRLASIEFIWPDGDMPLFLDETLIAYDEERMTATLRWLAGNYPGQVFLSTCHRREGKVLSALSAPFSRINI